MRKETYAPQACGWHIHTAFAQFLAVSRKSEMVAMDT
jgi:hypothetical protein